MDEKKKDIHIPETPEPPQRIYPVPEPVKTKEKEKKKRKPTTKKGGK